MADTQPISAKIIAVSQKGDGFKVEGYDNWFNLTNDYQGVAIPPVGTEIEFKYKPWLNPKSHKTAYYVDEIIPVTQVAAAPVSPPPVAQTTNHPQSLAGPHVPSTTAPPPAPVAQVPRNGPESVTPDPGSFAYRDTIGIPRTACLKDAGELLASVYAGGASELLSDEQLDHLAANITRLANRLYERYYMQGPNIIADVAMPDDTPVPTPSEADSGPQEP